MLILGYPLNKQVQVIQGFWEDNFGHPTRKNYYKLFDNHHPGVDFSTPAGKSVVASFEGVVVRKEFHSGMGNVLGVRNGNIVVLYAHLNKFCVKLGSRINSGSLIALTGATGSCGRPAHLHFELRDISIKGLRNMVFKPEFDKPIKQWMNTFVYKVNNLNTKKTLKFLALRYFGDKNKWGLIRNSNPEISTLKADDLIEDGLDIVIPNFNSDLT